MFPNSIISWLAITCFVVYAVRRGIKWTVLHPFPQICALYAVCFGFPLPDASAQFRVDIAHVAAFVTFSGALLGTERQLKNKAAFAFLDRIWPRKQGSLALRRLQPRTIYSLTAGCSVVLLWFNVEYVRAFGSLTQVLLRLRSKTPEEALPSIVLQSESLVFLLVLSVFVVLRIQGRLFATRIALCCSWLLAAELAITFLPSGTSGYLMSLVTAVFVADAVLGVRSGRRSLSIAPFALVGCCLVAVPFLFSTRTTNFHNVDELLARGDSPELILRGADTVATYSRDMNAWVDYSLTTYGAGTDYLWFRSLWAIAVLPVPRSVWPQKPYGFGRVLFHPASIDADQNTGSTAWCAVAAGLAGEGWANGGFIGLVTLSALFGVLCGAATKVFTAGITSGSNVHLCLAFMARTLACGFVRGDLLAAWVAYAVPLGLTCFLVWAWSHWPGRAAKLHACTGPLRAPSSMLVGQK